MAKNITLMGADYPDVPAVQLPKTGGGTATFYDPDELMAWKIAAEETTTADQLFDKTVQVTIPSSARELMFTLQRASNGRTFATGVMPLAQFNGGALYINGEYSLGSDTFANLSYVRHINAVVIDAGNNSIEIAINANNEAIKARVFYR